MTKFEEFQKAFPEMYEKVRCGFCCPPGWMDLMWELSTQIQSILNLPENAELKKHFRVDQVKEKFGLLRVYASFYDEKIEPLIEKAQSASSKICDTCGKPGVLRVGGWLATLCDEHAKGRKPYIEEKE
jgi:hypothetical protein